MPQSPRYGYIAAVLTALAEVIESRRGQPTDFSDNLRLELRDLIESRAIDPSALAMATMELRREICNDLGVSSEPPDAEDETHSTTG